MPYFSLRTALGAEEQAKAVTACLAGLLASLSHRLIVELVTFINTPRRLCVQPSRSRTTPSFLRSASTVGVLLDRNFSLGPQAERLCRASPEFPTGGGTF